MKIIAKFSPFVIFAFVCSALLSSCHEGPRKTEIDASASAYGSPVTTGKMSLDEIDESSGLAASPCQPEVLWTHNDSGDEAFIYAMNVKGESLGVWRVTGAENDDWEDMAAVRDASGACQLYVGDIGNTDKLTKARHKIYRFAEPMVSPENKVATKRAALATDAATVLEFRYSDTPHDAEALLVHPQTGDIYLLTKNRDTPSAVFKLVPTFGTSDVAVAQKLGPFSVPAIPNGFLTGAAISPDGRRVAICDYAAGYEITLPDGAANFDEIWKQKPIAIELGSRKQGEAITYTTDGKSLIATSEKKASPIIQLTRK